MTCEHCGNPSPTPTCDRCLGYQQYASSSRGDNQTVDRHLTRKLGEARADLVALPDLLDQLARCLTERNPSPGGGGGKVTGSPAPLRLEVLHLVDDREKPLWWGEDPRTRDLADGYGVTYTLASWTRVAAEELAEPPELAEHPTARTEVAVLLEVWDWIVGQQWAEELADDILHLAAQVRASLGIRREYRPTCRYCRGRVQPVDRDHNVTTWEACAYGLCTLCGANYPPGPALVALGQVQEPLTLPELAETTGIPLATLHRWVAAGALTPEPTTKKRGRRYDLAATRAVATRLYGRTSA